MAKRQVELPNGLKAGSQTPNVSLSMKQNASLAEEAVWWARRLFPERAPPVKRIASMTSVPLGLVQELAGVSRHKKRTLSVGLQACPACGITSQSFGGRWIESDAEAREKICRNCGIVVEQTVLPLVHEGHQFGRGPDRPIMFGGNKGTKNVQAVVNAVLRVTDLPGIDWKQRNQKRWNLQRYLRPGEDPYWMRYALEYTSRRIRMMKAIQQRVDPGDESLENALADDIARLVRTGLKAATKKIIPRNRIIRDGVNDILGLQLVPNLNVYIDLAKQQVMGSVQGIDFHKVLGVSPAASKGEIKQRYRELVLKWHPDRNDSPEAVQRFRDIQQAYEGLVVSK